MGAHGKTPRDLWQLRTRLGVCDDEDYSWLHSVIFRSGPPRITLDGRYVTIVFLESLLRLSRMEKDQRQTDAPEKT
jgi:hypothetical protein